METFGPEYDVVRDLGNVFEFFHGSLALERIQDHGQESYKSLSRVETACILQTTI